MREDGDATYERCKELGVKVHFPPEEGDRDEPGYWALFFDPDGFRIEVFHWPGDPLG